MLLAKDGEPATKPVDQFAGMELSLMEEAPPPEEKPAQDTPLEVVLAKPDIQAEATPAVAAAPAVEPDLKAFGGLELALEEEGVTPPAPARPSAEPALESFGNLDMALVEDAPRPIKLPGATALPEPPEAPSFDLEPLASAAESPPSPPPGP